MGVHIKGMEMPIGKQIIELRIYADGVVTRVHDRTCRKIAEATEVPEPHGRLIDADALADDLEADGKEFGDEMKLNCASWLRSNATPTVIERSNHE